jgi:hypothetical protein
VVILLGNLISGAAITKLIVEILNISRFSEWYICICVRICAICFVDLKHFKSFQCGTSDKNFDQIKIIWISIFILYSLKILKKIKFREILLHKCNV